MSPAEPPSAPALPNGWLVWVAGARPRTLPAAIVPVLVGTASAAGVAPGDAKGTIVWRSIAAMIVALAIQVATNFANDYSDGKRGTDDPTQRVGPPRLVGWGLASPGAVKRAVMISFGIAGVAGLALAYAVGWWLILVGVACFAAGWFYTGGPKPYGYAGLGEVFVFVFFGLVATVGSYYVQVEAIAVFPVAMGIAVGALATALLVINNLRDIPSDTVSGKRTLAVKIGDRRTRFLYVVLMVLPFLIVPVACGLGGRPLGAVSLFSIVLANQPVLAVLQGASGRDLIPVLGATGRVQLAFGVLLSVGLVASAAP